MKAFDVSLANVIIDLAIPLDFNGRTITREPTKKHAARSCKTEARSDRLEEGVENRTNVGEREGGEWGRAVKGVENRESSNGVVGAFNIFLVNLTAPFRFIAGLGVQVLSVWVRGRLIFNFISPSLHFIDGVACRRRHLARPSLCS